MGKLVTVNAGVTALLLPAYDGPRVFNGGATATLTEAEYSALNSSQTNAITLTTSGLPEPARKSTDPSATRDNVVAATAGALVLKVGFNEVTLGGNITSVSVAADNPTSNPRVYGAKAGNASFVNVKLVQDATGSRTVTWGSSFKFAGGTAPTLQTAAGKIDIITFVSTDGGTTWYETGRSLNVG